MVGFRPISAKLGPKTPLERRGSSCSAGCIKNQPRRWSSPKTGNRVPCSCRACVRSSARGVRGYLALAPDPCPAPPPAAAAHRAVGPVVSQWGPGGVPMVSRWCPGGVPVVSRWCPSGVLVVSRWCPGAQPGLSLVVSRRGVKIKTSQQSKSVYWIIVKTNHSVESKVVFANHVKQNEVGNVVSCVCMCMCMCKSACACVSLQMVAASVELQMLFAEDCAAKSCWKGFSR